MLRLRMIPWGRIPLKRVVQLNAHKAAAYRYLGATCLRQGRCVEAIPSLENPVLLDPKNTDALAMLDRSLVLAGRPADAAGPLEQHLRPDPATPPVASIWRRPTAPWTATLKRFDTCPPIYELYPMIST